MTRPKRRRRILRSPDTTFFKPQGIPLREIQSVDLSLDEFEAIRLKYVEGVNNAEGAKSMKISDSTFQRIISSGLKKVADALVNGKAIEIHKLIDFNYQNNL